MRGAAVQVLGHRLYVVAARAFALSASFEDAGAAAASEHLQLDLGETVAAIFEQASAEGWRPDPKKWSGEVAHTPE